VRLSLLGHVVHASSFDGRSSHMLAAPLVDTKTKNPIGIISILARCSRMLRISLTVPSGMAAIRSRKGAEGRFLEDAEVSFRKFMEVICELFARADVDEVLLRQRAAKTYDDD
jgi:hypothetical protein